MNEIEQLKNEVLNLQAIVAELQAQLNQQIGSDVVRSLLPEGISEVGGMFVSGTPQIRKGAFYREYDENGNVVPPGEETGTLETNINDGHTLVLTADYARVHS